MRKLLIIAAAALLASPGISAPAFAQAAPPTQSAKPAKDPNEIICERRQQLGSRLPTERVCKTRAEWAGERRMNPQDVEKAQMQRDLSH